MGNAVLPLVILAGSGALVYTGITDPEGGAFAGLGRLLRGEPGIKRAADPSAFAGTTADLAGTKGSAFGGQLGGGTKGGAWGTNPVPSGVRGRVLAEASSWIGVPYRWGGNSRLGVDCSGLTVQVYSKAAGIILPRVSAAQALMGQRRTLANAQPADLVFFARSGLVHHVGIYAGGGQIIHSPHPGAMVRVESIWSGETVTVRDVLTATAKRHHQAPTTSTKGTGATV